MIRRRHGAWRPTVAAPMVAAIALACALSSGSVAQAQAQTRPSTASVAGADRSTPRGAMKVLAVAIEQGDQRALDEVLSADNENEQRLKNALVRMFAAVAQLRAAAATAYGADGAKSFVSAPGRAAGQLARIDAAEVRIDGDRATVRVRPDEPPIELVKRDGQWRVAMADQVRGLEANRLDGQLRLLASRAAAVQQTAEEIREGKLKTAEEAGQVLQTRLMSADGKEATTAPANAER